MSNNILSLKENNEFIVVQFKNQSGELYEVGYSKEAGYTADEIKLGLSKVPALKSGNYCDLKWEVDVRPSETSDCAKKIGIAEGYVEGGSHTIYQCRMHFRNTQGWWFDFIDGNKEEYRCYTARNCWHYVDYNSSKPTIIGVR